MKVRELRLALVGLDGEMPIYGRLEKQMSELILVQHVSLGKFIGNRQTSRGVMGIDYISVEPENPEDICTSLFTGVVIV